LFTTTGLCLLGAVEQVAEKTQYGKWFMPLAVSNSLNHEVVIFAVKDMEKLARQMFEKRLEKAMRTDGGRIDY
jgi:hypothetical protein